MSTRQSEWIGGHELVSIAREMLLVLGRFTLWNLCCGLDLLQPKETALSRLRCDGAIPVWGLGWRATLALPRHIALVSPRFRCSAALQMLAIGCYLARFLFLAVGVSKRLTRM